MKRFFTLLLLSSLVAINCLATNYYCAPNGNDNNTGTISSPWFSLHRAWQAVQPGDTVFLRGGTYAYTAQIQGYCVGKNGTAANKICVFAYPGETPVITKTSSYQNNQEHWRGGVYFEGNYTHWRGITFTGFVWDDNSNPFIWRGFYAEKANFNIFERFVSYANECGFSLQDDSKGNLMLNIDTYNNYHQASGGGHADGFSVGYITAIDAANPNIVKGCRSWNNGDDGFDTWMNHGFITFDSCWSWHNGYNWHNSQPAGDGNGYKLGRTDIASSQFRRVLKNCIAYDNRERGFDKNDVQFAMQIFNCVAYQNGGTGFALDNTNGNVFRNNFALNNGNGNANIAYTSSSHNACGGTGGNCDNWNIPISTNDFYTDASGLVGQRQSNGTLPNIVFLHLTPTATQLINAGINVGIPYSGTAPDIGTFETGTPLPPPNQPPVANAGPDQTITLPTNSITQTGNGSDPDGTITSFLWTKIAGPATFNIVSPTSAQTVINNLVQGVYQFELLVTDNGGATDRDTMQVTVNAAPPPPNQPPTANAGPNQTITLPVNTVTVNGSGSDPDGTITAYLWTRISGPTTFTIVSPTSATTVINNLVQGVYQFELRVTDNNGAFGRDTMQVTVNAAPPPPNQPPVANAGPDQTLTLPVNSLTASGSGTDPDGTIVSYQWNKIAGPAQFVIISPVLAQTVINNLVQGVYQFELRVTDNNGATGRDTMTVTVNAAPPPPNQPPVANAGTDQAITLPVNSVTVNGSGTDPDGTITAYLWTRISGPTTFTIVSPTSATTVINNLVQGVYQFELRVTDNNGAFGRDTLQVTVNAAPPPPNQPPTANAGPDTTITLPVNTVIISGSGSDPDGTIASYQWNKIAGPASYTIVFPNQPQTAFADLVEGVYLFELVVTDNNGATARDTLQVTVLQNPARTSTAMIYPNPATSVINIRIDAVTYSNKTSIRIINALGVPVYHNEVMRTQQSSIVPVDVSRLPAGSYFAIISVDINNSITLPFIKQ